MKIEIVGPSYPEQYLDADGEPQERYFYSFLVDGVPSLKWYPECNIPGLPKTYYVERCMNRLKAGRSSEAFGTAPMIAVNGQVLNSAALSAGNGRGAIKQLKAKSTQLVAQGDRSKPVEGRPLFKYVLDGKESSEEFPTEAAARTACAFKAFMTRHKLGQIPAAQLALEKEFPGKVCKVWACPQDHEIKATVGGKQYAIGWVKVDGKWVVERFKPMEEVVQSEE